MIYIQIYIFSFFLSKLLVLYTMLVKEIKRVQLNLLFFFTIFFFFFVCTCINPLQAIIKSTPKVPIFQ